MAERYLSTGELAKLCHMTKHTVLGAIASGKIVASTTPGGHHRIHARDAVRFMRMHGLPTGALESRLPTVLVVGRDALVQQILQGVLDPSQITTQRAESVFEAGMLTERLNPDLVILDAPARGEAAEIHRALTDAADAPKARLLVLSASGDSVEEAALSAAGVVILKKPFNVEELRRSVLELIGAAAAAVGR